MIWYSSEILSVSSPLFPTSSFFFLPSFVAFTENNIQGVTGYRCRTFDDYLNATLDCLEGKINYIDCRKKGEEFLLDKIAPKYEKFFEDVINVESSSGWYTIKSQTQNRIKELK